MGAGVTTKARVWQLISGGRRAADELVAYAAGAVPGPSAMGLLDAPARQLFMEHPATARAEVRSWSEIFAKSLASLATFCDEVDTGTCRPSDEDLASVACSVSQMFSRLNRRLDAAA